MECEKLARCHFFDQYLSTMPTNTRLIQRKYCRNDYGRCARYLLHKFLEKSAYAVSDELEARIGKIAPSLFPHDVEKLRSVLRVNLSMI